MSAPQAIYHITGRAAWQAALAAGQYTADSLEREGFIHASSREQVLATAERFYAGQAGLVLLRIRPARLAAKLRWENSEGGSPPFPHIYGPLNLEAVDGVADFLPGPDGHFQLPDFA